MIAVSGRHKQQLQAKFDSYYLLTKQNKANPVSLYLNSLAPSGRRSIKSLLISSMAVLGFDGPLEAMPWNLVGYQQLAQIRNQLGQQGKAANTINLALSALRGVMRSCFNLGLIKADQLMLLNNVKPVRSQRLPKGRSLSGSEIGKLHRSCAQDKSVAGKRDHALIALMLVTGLRRSEVVAIGVKDFNSRTGVLNIQAGKGGKQRLAFLNSNSRQVIRQWRQMRGNHAGYLFNPVAKNGTVINRPLTGQSIYDIVQQRSELAQIGKVRPHDLRRTFVTQLLEAGVDLNITRQLAGHSDIQTTARYDCRDQKSQKKALQQLGK
jgi:site-specific recombinase XerD